MPLLEEEKEGDEEEENRRWGNGRGWRNELWASHKVCGELI